MDGGTKLWNRWARNKRINLASAWKADTQHSTHGSRSGKPESGHPSAAATTSRCVGSNNVASRSGDRPARAIRFVALERCQQPTAWRGSAPVIACRHFTTTSHERSELQVRGMERLRSLNLAPIVAILRRRRATFLTRPGAPHTGPPPCGSPLAAIRLGGSIRTGTTRASPLRRSSFPAGWRSPHLRIRRRRHELHGDGPRAQHCRLSAPPAYPAAKRSLRHCPARAAGVQCGRWSAVVPPILRTRSASSSVVAKI